MKNILIPFAAALCILTLAACTQNQQMSSDSRSHQEILFDDGNYAMFIHFGLYSHLESQWQGKAYYGNAEWIMHPSQAGIPVKEYMPLAAEFNPSDFDADAIVKLAKDAGMKYIIITSKHHEGFAMFDSDVCDFNIKDATPFGRDVIGELSEACHRNGIGIGFYYSQFQDWTAPGGGSGPCQDENGRKVSFDEYFRTKCVPQVEEITTKYGEIQLIWFDTPGDMDIKYSEELVALVHKNQPGALVSSRVGNGLGDYETLGDMEVPVQNVPGRWEGIDVMQVGWGFSKFDNEWKSPEYVLHTLLSTIARGGVFMMNVGPTAKGAIPEQAAASLRKAGEWVHKYPKAVYAAGASPWGHALPWGDAVTAGNDVYLLVYDWPKDGKLLCPALNNKVKSVRLYNGKKLRFNCNENWLEIKVPSLCPEKLASVIKLELDGEPSAKQTHPVIPGYKTDLSVLFAGTSDCIAQKKGYMVRYGEWNTLWNIADISQSSEITWTIDIPEEGYYDLSLYYNDDLCSVSDSDSADWISQMARQGVHYAEWTATSDEGFSIRNKQPAYKAYTWQRLGLMKFNSAGRRTVTVRMIDGDWGKVNLGFLRVEKFDM